jgi:hypothetical protein
MNKSQRLIQHIDEVRPYVKGWFNPTNGRFWDVHGKLDAITQLPANLPSIADAFDAGWVVIHNEADAVHFDSAKMSGKEKSTTVRFIIKQKRVDSSKPAVWTTHEKSGEKKEKSFKTLLTVA